MSRTVDAYCGEASDVIFAPLPLRVRHAADLPCTSAARPGRRHRSTR
ncbi:hypothetical protein OG785_09430 [Streptomyces sp. NBC_00006]|nr:MULTISPECIES: hypothetical protein [unclassified Streptomyces]MCX4829890.1 hypothetical protein [Streptomyces sp. NBC_01016]MCX5530780.1 hypothetical protein [Streptomyces sp. NBC_00006]